MLDALPDHADLRELGLIGTARNQGQCGDCFAFGAVAQWENSMLLDAAFYQKEQGMAFDATNLNLSELYVGYNAKGMNSFCNGGDSVMLNSWFVQNQGQKVPNILGGAPGNAFRAASAADFPYNSSVDNLQFYQDAFFIAQDSQYDFLPFQQNATQNDTPNVLIYYNEQQPFDAAAIQNVKSYLARGYLVLASIYSDDDWSYYQSGQVMTGACPNDVNHQVAFVGYGMYQNKQVWVMRNSWGSDWGAGGFFYLEIGANTYCSEMYAFVVKTKY